MANPEHLAILMQGVEIWNTWRASKPHIKPDFSEADLIGVNLCPITVCDTSNTSYKIVANLAEANLRKTALNNAQLAESDFRGADLREAILDGAQLTKANFDDANLSKALLRDVSLWNSTFKGANLKGACFIHSDLSSSNFNGADLREAIFTRSDLMDAKLCQADLRRATLSAAYLVRANLSNADLRQAILIKAQVIDSNFQGAKLTGACLENWNISEDTVLDNVDCKYFYWQFDLKNREYKERRPSDPNRNFNAGEFTKLIQKVFNTVDLIFDDGIDWEAFFQSFQELRAQYGEENLSIQAVEKKSGKAFVIRLEVPLEANKAAIESQAKELYKMKLQIIEERYRAELNVKDREVEIYKQQNASMEKIVERLATREETKVSLHPNQLKILQTISNGINIDSEISEAVGISIETTRYYIETLKSEDYLKFMEWNDGISIDKNYSCELTNKGKVAVEKPDLLLPSRKEAANNTINYLQGANIANFANQVQDNARQVASNLSQNIGQNIDDITRLIRSLREMAQEFPEAQREEALMDLDNLQEDISTPEKQKPERIKIRLSRLLVIAGTIASVVAGSADFSNNVLELAEKLGVPIEISHPQPVQQLPTLKPNQQSDPPNSNQFPRQ